LPTYTYQCGECDLIFEEFHSMSETIEDCHSCGATSSVKRVVSKNLHIKKPNHSPFSQRREKPGSVVKQFIRDAKKDLNAEKESLSKKVYDKK
tara:strand:+ start:272 stop:550 length:279 start_codon:yes stop_codon:yes gene_type:complete